MTQETTNTVSLLQHCKSCRTPCCEENSFIISKVEHQRIMDAGAPDHFAHITVRGVTSYMLDFRQSVCAYNTNGQCTIEEYKPIICRTYPMVGEGNFAPICPARMALTEAYRAQAIQLLKEKRTLLPDEEYRQAYVAYERRNNPQDLIEMQASVQMPRADVLSPL